MVFEPGDLQRVRLADGADLMWELVLGLRKAQRCAVPAPLVAWRQRIDDLPVTVGPLRTLVARTGDFPDFLTPAELVTDLDAGCVALSCTPRARLAADVASVFRGRADTPWLRDLAAGDRDAVGDVVRAARVAYALLLAPHWDQVRGTVAVDRARRADELAARGVGALLAGLPGVLGWDGHVLRLHYPEHRTVHLGGRGLVLVPSYFCWGNPITWIDPELPPVLVYQAGPCVGGPEEVVVPRRLVALLGRTRAECLRLLLVPRSTSDLAEQLGTSIGNASKHASVLRDAGLVTSTRHGTTVVHTVTALGVALLTGH
jgi:DNA-binding transcriptional ArsR family regulator